MNRSACALRAAWMLAACPVFAAKPGERCRVTPGAFQLVFHRERAAAKAVKREEAFRLFERRTA